MKNSFWFTLVLFLVVLPIFAQDVTPIDTINTTINTITLNDIESANTIQPNEGFSINSLWRGILGMSVLILISFLFSANRKAINWKTTAIGLGIQLLLAIGILKVPFIQNVFNFLGMIFNEILNFTVAGSKFLLGNLLNLENPNIGYIFAFQILPTIIFFSALTSVLFYLGIIQKIVKALAWLLTKSLGISGAESLSVAGNIFLGQTEAPLMIKAYLEKMNRSEILLVMIGGSNLLDAISIGTTEGLKLAVNVGAMLLVFVAFIAMINGVFNLLGDVTSLNNWMAANTSYPKFSLEAVLGTIFAPLMWLIGVASDDIMQMGQLLGIKLASSEFVGYTQLATLKNPINPGHFEYKKSIIMATYMLCGFANFASIGIQIGGIGSLAPGQRKTLSEFGMKAVLGGSLASLLSATIAGMILG